MFFACLRQYSPTTDSHAWESKMIFLTLVIGESEIIGSIVWSLCSTDTMIRLRRYCALTCQTHTTTYLIPCVREIKLSLHT